VKVLGLEIINAKQVRLKDDEIKQIVEIESHRDVRQWLIIDVGDDFEIEFQGYRQFFNQLKENRDAEVLVAKYDGRIAGFLVLWRLEKFMEHVASVGISVHPDSWGKGVATSLMESAIKLAREKGFKRLEIETLAENKGMRRTAEKMGFKYEGVRVNRILKSGAYHDEVLYYLLLNHD
jgi:RimJ/RimL family protein N-acetyltransferase